MYTTKCCTYAFLYLIQLRALRLNGTTMSSSLYCLACRKGKSKSNLQTNKAGDQKKRIIRSFRVYSILLFHDLSRVLQEYVVSLVCYCSDQIFQWFILKFRRKKGKCDEMQSATQPFLVSSRNAPPHKRLLRIKPHSFPFVFVV